MGSEVNHLESLLVGEQIVSIGINKDGAHIATRNGLILVLTICEGRPVLGVLQTDETVHH